MLTCKKGIRLISSLKTGGDRERSHVSATSYLRKNGEGLSGRLLAHAELGEDVFELLVVDDVVTFGSEKDKVQAKRMSPCSRTQA